MNDELDKLRREVERLTAELSDQKADYRAVLTALVAKEWEGVTQADLDAALASPFSFQPYIDQLDAAEAGPGGRDG